MLAQVELVVAVLTVADAVLLVALLHTCCCVVLMSLVLALFVAALMAWPLVLTLLMVVEVLLLRLLLLRQLLLLSAQVRWMLLMPTRLVRMEAASIPHTADLLALLQSHQWPAACLQVHPSLLKRAVAEQHLLFGEV